MNRADIKRDHAIREVIMQDPSWSSWYSQLLYMNETRTGLKPNVAVYRGSGGDAEFLFEINSDGFKGGEIDRSRKLAAVWGDSVVWGEREGWVAGLNQLFPEYHFINGGIQGDPLENIAARAIEANCRMEISVNIIYPGWHSRRRPSSVRETLDRMIDLVPNAVLCTVFTSLNRKFIARDMSHVFAAESPFYFFGNWPYSPEAAKKIYSEITAQNDIVREVARERGAACLDLFERFYNEDMNEFKRDFYDVCHLRISAFPKVQRVLSGELLRAGVLRESGRGSRAMCGYGMGTVCHALTGMNSRVVDTGSGAAGSKV